jgi:hypothetical protein
MGVVAGLVRGEGLGPLLRYDTEHRAELVHTLSV